MSLIYSNQNPRSRMSFLQLYISKLIFNETSNLFLKPKFSSKLLTIILCKSEFYFYDIQSWFWNFLDYNSNRKILLIFLSYAIPSRVFEYMVDRNLLNVIALNYHNFDEFPIIYTFDVIRSKHFSFLERSLTVRETNYNKFQKESYFNGRTLNLNGASIYFLMSNEFPRTQTYSEDVTFGYVGNLLHTFCKLYKGTLKILYDNSYDDEESLNFFDSHIIDFTNNYKHFDYLKDDITDVYLMSTVLELMPWTIIVPRPRPIKDQLYILKPFDFYIYFAILICIFLASIFSKGSFWINFTDFFRTILSNSYDFHSRKNFQQFHLLFVIFGFIMTTFYCSFIGSFLTTILYEKPIHSLEDIKKSGIKILVNNRENFESYPELKAYKEVFEKV